jgi:hypothetical protein
VGREDATSRRRFIQRLTSAVAVAPALARPIAAQATVPVRALTHPPGHHWFGYYDKLQFSPDDRYVLGMRTSFEGRTPRVEDELRVGMVDTREGGRWLELGTSRAWGWQQGCMLQWRPPAANEVLWNDREDGPDGSRFVTRVLDVASGRARTLPRPFYAVSPDGTWAIGADFARIQRLRPGYGYQGVLDAHADERAPRGSGIYDLDLSSGASRLVVSIADLVAVPHQQDDFSGATHWVNHLLVAPGGKRFLFLHRWRHPAGSPAGERYRDVGGFGTRMFTVDRDGSGLFVLDLSGYTSHFVWDDPEHVTAWTRPLGRPPGFYRFRDRTREVEPVGAGVMTENGHNTYVPGTGNSWILNDTYPDRERREQALYLFHQPSERKVVLGRFHSPAEYAGEWRVDLHPRSSRDGTKVCIDSTHGGQGRQLYLLDVGPLLR